MPAVARSRPKRFNYRKLPVWVQWALPFGVGAILVVALVVWVQHETNDVPSEAIVGQKALATEVQQADVTMRQTQAPHTARLPAGVAPAAGLKAAITTWLNGQIKTGQMNGPLSGVSCATSKGSTSARVAMECKLVTANVTYPFYGVVIPASRSITYCQKVAYPPQYGMPVVKLSSSCLPS